MFTKLLGWLKKMTPEELSKYTMEVLKGALTILESQEKPKEEERGIDFLKYPDDVILAVRDVLQKQKEIQDKIDLSKIPDDVLDMAIKIGEKELEAN